MYPLWHNLNGLLHWHTISAPSLIQARSHLLSFACKWIGRTETHERRGGEGGGRRRGWWGKERRKGQNVENLFITTSPIYPYLSVCVSIWNSRFGWVHYIYTYINYAQGINYLPEGLWAGLGSGLETGSCHLVFSLLPRVCSLTTLGAALSHYTATKKIHIPMESANYPPALIQSPIFCPLKAFSRTATYVKPPLCVWVALPI